MKSLLYTGDPAKAKPPSETPPVPYLADEGLVDAVNVALILEKPLLVTGEPGTGKTCLAASVAAELGLKPPLRFQTKSTSTARDLFYYYDAIRHFHASQTLRSPVQAAQFISIQALGKAILRTRDPAEVDAVLTDVPHDAPQRSVVLIDEVDKAPRDFPNDILYELEDLCFQIPELGGIEFRASGDPKLRPIVVFTSNSEKNLPDAFLRRCVYYHIPFPEAGRLRRIVEMHHGSLIARADLRMAAALDLFARFRDKAAFRKPPATAELIAWIQMLAVMGGEGVADVSRSLRDESMMRKSLSVLFKTYEDLKPAEAVIKQWLSDQSK